MILNGILGALAVVSFGLSLWQWFVARRFPLHQRSADLRSGANRGQPNINEPGRRPALQPAVTLLKPLKDADEHTEACLRSWFTQDYAGEIQMLFGVEDASDPACAVVNKLLAEFPRHDAQLVLCPEQTGANGKVAKLAQLEPLAKHEILVVSDADVRVPPDLLANLVSPLRMPEVGLVNCFYRLANPTTPAMHWEAIAINADFWSQVLQSTSIRKPDFALGAAMATRRKQLQAIGGFRALVNCLADDYQLGNRIAQQGTRIEFCPVVVECWSEPLGWRDVWKHQLRWARTIRVCQPVPYFFSILSNATLWPLLWLIVSPTIPVLAFCTGCLLARILSALNLERRLTQRGSHVIHCGLIPIKDLLQIAIWLLAFMGNRIEWRGERMRLRRDGTLMKA